MHFILLQNTQAFLFRLRALTTLLHEKLANRTGLGEVGFATLNRNRLHRLAAARTVLPRQSFVEVPSVVVMPHAFGVASPVSVSILIVTCSSKRHSRVVVIVLLLGLSL